MSKTNVRGLKRAHAGIVVAALLILVASAGCQGPRRIDQLAERHGFVRDVVRGEPYRHVIYRTPRIESESHPRLHVYIDGDGIPWHRGRSPSRDPTPRHPLALELMAVDPAPAIYLGRPCYHGLATSAPCAPRGWTSARYSEEVVASMAAALDTALAAQPRAAVTLFGYSGGGVLALLVAERSPRVDTVVTVAANLDIDAWTAARGFVSLTGSTNPADRAEWRRDLRQIHLAGARDSIVPLQVVRSFTDRVPGATLEVFPDHDHVCCWVDAWPAVLDAYRLTPARGRADAAH